MKNSSYKQQGLSTLGWLVMLAILGVLLTAGFRLGPIYLDNYFVRAAIKSMADEDIESMTNADIRDRMGRTFDINNIRNVSVKDLKIKREKERVLISLNYENRVNFMGNLDFVAVFTNEYDTSEPK
jgi:hypothetical protein